MASVDLQTPFNSATNSYLDHFTSVSGSDISCMFGHSEFLNIQGISVSVNREVQPIYVMGYADPISFVRGKRGIAGTFMTVCNDRGALYDIMDLYGVYGKKKGDNIPGRQGIIANTPGASSNTNLLSQVELLGYTLATPSYEDQLPPFDATLVGRTQSFATTVSRIGGMHIVSKGTGMSVDDNSIEQQMAYVAMFYEDWRPVGKFNVRPEAAQGRTYGDYNQFSEGAQGKPITAIDPATGRLVTYNPLDQKDDVIGELFGLNYPSASAA